MGEGAGRGNFTYGYKREFSEVRFHRIAKEEMLWIMDQYIVCRKFHRTIVLGFIDHHSSYFIVSIQVSIPEAFFQSNVRI